MKTIEWMDQHGNNFILIYLSFEETVWNTWFSTAITLRIRNWFDEFRFSVSYLIKVWWYTGWMDISMKDCKQCRVKITDWDIFDAPVECSLRKMPKHTALWCALSALCIRWKYQLEGKFYPVLLRAIATIETLVVAAFLFIAISKFLEFVITANHAHTWIMTNVLVKYICIPLDCKCLTHWNNPCFAVFA